MNETFKTFKTLNRFAQFKTLSEKLRTGRQKGMNLNRFRLQTT